MANTHHYQDLISLFNSLFQHSENTILIGNAEEPLYLPADAESVFDRIIFTRDYFASALHEIAHWCIASKQRREQVDYGYWYFPEGRSAAQQAQFEQAEIKPQALEMLFTEAAGSRILVSQDNLQTGFGQTRETFTQLVAEQAQAYLCHGLPERAEIFRNALLNFYQLK